MRRLGANAFTVHGMRASFRMWAADTGVAFEVAEACLAHAVGNAVVAAYQRSTMLERRRPVLQAWADFIEKPVTDVAPLRPLRSDLIDPTIAVHSGRVVKRTGDGSIVEFRSVVDAVHCAIELQNAMVERNAGVPEDRRIVFRIGIHLGDVVEEADGDLMGDGVNIAARLEGVAKPGTICLSEQAYWQVKSRLDLAVVDLAVVDLGRPN